MDYEITEIDDEVPTELEVELNISREGFKGLAKEMAEDIFSHKSVEYWDVVRKGKRDPVIKANGSRIYFNWEDGTGEVSLGLANPDVADDALEWLKENSEGGVHSSKSEEGGRGNDNGTSKSRRDGKGVEETENSGGGVNGNRSVQEGSSTGKASSSGSGDKTGQVFKPFSHSEAVYMEPGGEGFSPEHSRCRDCAHWDDHGNCHIVHDVEPDGYCEEFYADVGVFGHKHKGYVEENLILVGEKFTWTKRQIKEFVSDMREALERKVR